MTNRTSSVSFQAPWEVQRVSVRVCVCVCVCVCEVWPGGQPWLWLSGC